jgi:hypothetical protein
MQGKFIYLLGLFLLVSCADNSENEGESFEDLPEGKWNGEYMEVESDEPSDKKRPTKKSNGGEILNLGKVVYSIGDDIEEITLFDKRKNDIIINEDQIAIRIKDANERFFLIRIHKDEIYKNPIGKYQDAKSVKSDKQPRFTLTYSSDLSGKQETYHLKSGALEVEKMSFTLGDVLMKVKGEVLNLKDIQEGTTQPFEMEVKMNFETIVSAFNPKV